MRFTEKDIQSEFDKRSKRVTQEDVDKIFQKRKEIEDKFSGNGPLGKFWSDLKLLFELVNDYRKGEYREIPWTSIAAIIGALLYVFNPFDVIPDFIPVFGLMDDAAVVALCLRAIDGDLQAYKKWKIDNVVVID